MALFRRNRFDEICRNYYSSFTYDTSNFQPSGWILSEPMLDGTLVNSQDIIAGDIWRYLIDLSGVVNKEKLILSNLLSSWSHRSIEIDEFTLIPSTTVGICAILSLLRQKGIRHLRIETPVYFSVLAAAKAFGYRVKLIPTYSLSNFTASIDEFLPDYYSPNCALWITQPKFCIGLNQSIESINRLCSSLRANDYLIFDEANEQARPPHLDLVIEGRAAKRIFRIRGITKQIGLNALRLASIIHHSSQKETLSRQLWTVGGTIDRFSLNAMLNFGKNPESYFGYLGAAKERSLKHSTIAKTNFLGEFITPSVVYNGPLGYAAFKWKSLFKSVAEARHNLLKICGHNKIFVELGDTSYFAIDPDVEFIRLHYGVRQQDIIHPLRLILSQLQDDKSEFGL